MALRRSRPTPGDTFAAQPEYVIQQVGMTRPHYQPGDLSRIRMLVLHATAGRYPGDYGWLRQGGSDAAPVSIHYYIDKAGTISQMVDDANIAWHAGVSSWQVDGTWIPEIPGCNPISLGIELENLNDGNDPYPPEQYAAVLWLTRRLVQQYAIPRDLLVRHLDIAPRRKTDPRAFPWTQFVDAVYAATPAPDLPTPPPDPAVPAAQLAALRRILTAASYEAVGMSDSDTATLHGSHLDRSTGMPVAALTPLLTWQAAPDHDERSITADQLQRVIAEVYADDLFFALADQPDSVRRLRDEPGGGLAASLLEALFRAADPANGFQPGWMFHQYYLRHAATLGVPLGANHRLPATTRDGQAYACQHFSYDTLCSPVGEWQTVLRLSELLSGTDTDDAAPPSPQRELHDMLLDDLYRQRTGRAFDADALFCRHAIAQGLGAPLAAPRELKWQEQTLVVAPYARDTLYCRVPDDGNWQHAPVYQMPATLGVGGVAGATGAIVGALLPLLQTAARTGGALVGKALVSEALPVLLTYGGRLLGHLLDEPYFNNQVLDLDPSPATMPSLVLVYLTGGIAAHDLRLPVWHAYVTRTGRVDMLRPLADTLRLGHYIGTHPRANEHALVVGVEGTRSRLTAAQRRGLVWVLRWLTQHPDTRVPPQIMVLERQVRHA